MGENDDDPGTPKHPGAANSPPPHPTGRNLSQQTVERAGQVNAMRRKRFVWRAASFICILAHTVPELRGGDEPAAQIDFFSAVWHDPHVDLFGDPDGFSQ